MFRFSKLLCCAYQNLLQSLPYVMWFHVCCLVEWPFGPKIKTLDCPTPVPATNTITGLQRRVYSLRITFVELYLSCLAFFFFFFLMHHWETWSNVSIWPFNFNGHVQHRPLTTSLLLVSHQNSHLPLLFFSFLYFPLFNIDPPSPPSSFPKSYLCSCLQPTCNSSSLTSTLHVPKIKTELRTINDNQSTVVCCVIL